MGPRLSLSAALLLCCTAVGALAKPVAFQSIEATFQSGAPEDLRAMAEGREDDTRGWSTAPQREETQALLFRTADPLEADLIAMTLGFSPGQNSSIAELALSATEDAHPSFAGHWEPMKIIRWTATNVNLERGGGNHLRAIETPQDGNGTGAVYNLVTRTPFRRTTAFLVEAFPVHRTEGDLGPRMAWSKDGDFLLTKFSLEVIPGSTNVALGAPVRTSHPVETRLNGVTADALTDGVPYTLVHPQASDLGASFFFEIDLGQAYAIDHIALRQRSEAWDLNRFSRMLVQLYDHEPGPGVEPVWKALDRADGSHPNAAEADLLHAADGQGQFRGRYLRISSDSPVPRSPQLAEVEVYEIRTLQLLSARADSREIAAASALSVPPDTRRLLLTLGIPQAGLAPEELFRWRLLGYRDVWLPARSLALETGCPPAGSYTFEAQAAHSDGSWDSATLSFPITVRTPFIQTPLFRWLAASAALLVGVLLSRAFTRRRMAILEARSALADERTRIARDMHDEVGARLAQLAVLQDVFASEFSLPDAAQESLRQLARTARQAVASLDEVVWTVDPQNDTLASTAEHLAQYATSYLAPLKITCRIVAPIDWPPVEIHAQARHELILAFKEALQNVVKHAHATEVTLILRHEPAQLAVRLSDNGCGLTERPLGSGHHGLRNMVSRLASIGGICTIDSPARSGTTVEMCVPLHSP